MKKIFTILLTFICLSAPAQEAMKILDEASNRIKKSGDVKVEFTASNFHGTEETESTQGFMLLKGKKMVMDTPTMKTWYDGKTQWSYIPESGEVNITTPTEKEMAVINPYSFLKVYKKGYKMTAKKVTLRGMPAYEVHLIARYACYTAQEIYVDVKESDHSLLCIRVRQLEDWSRITIHNIQSKQNFADSDFIFPSEKYPDVEEIDLR